jgi:hypothetical protein
LLGQNPKTKQRIAWDETPTNDPSRELLGKTPKARPRIAWDETLAAKCVITWPNSNWKAEELLFGGHARFSQPLTASARPVKEVLARKNRQALAACKIASRVALSCLQNPTEARAGHSARAPIQSLQKQKILGSVLPSNSYKGLLWSDAERHEWTGGIRRPSQIFKACAVLGIKIA